MPCSVLVGDNAEWGLLRNQGVETSLWWVTRLLMNPFLCQGCMRLTGWPLGFFPLLVSSCARAVRVSLASLSCSPPPESRPVPGLSDTEKRQILSCVVVGGGPTGVEFSGELGDFIRKDVSEKYAHVKDYISITLVEVCPRCAP